MLREAFNLKRSNDSLIDKLFRFFSCIYRVYYYVFASQYILQIDDFYYCYRRKCYIIDLRFRNKGYILTVNIEDMRTDKFLLHFISPIDCYIIGIIYGMQQHKVIYNESKMLLEIFRQYNTPQVIEPMILVSERSFINGAQEITLKPKYCNTLIKTTWRDISKKPYLIQNLSPADAITVGITSFGCFIDEVLEVVPA